MWCEHCQMYCCCGRIYEDCPYCGTRYGIKTDPA